MTSSRTSRGGLALVDHRLQVPLDHDDPGGEQLEVFAREVTAPGGEDRPWLVFLQGGPGFESPRPAGAPAGWMQRARCRTSGCCCSTSAGQAARASRRRTTSP